MDLTLETQWIARLRLRAEGRKLWAQGSKLWAEGGHLRTEGGKLSYEGSQLISEGNKLWAEGDNLHAKGNKLWAEAILSVHGNMPIQWKWRDIILDCYMKNGEIYRGDMEKSND